MSVSARSTPRTRSRSRRSGTTSAAGAGVCKPGSAPSHVAPILPPPPRLLREILVCHTSRHPDGDGRPRRRRLDSPNQLSGFLRPYLAHSPQERMVGVLLDAQARLLGTVELGLGDQDLMVADLKVMARGIAATAAQRVVLAHNHPSGRLRFSQQDRLLTDKARVIASALGAELLDHLLFVPDGRWVSMMLQASLRKQRRQKGAARP